MVVSLKCFFLCISRTITQQDSRTRTGKAYSGQEGNCKTHDEALLLLLSRRHIYISLWSDYTFGIKTQKEGRIEQNRTVCAVPHLLNMFLNVQMHMYLCLRACEVFTWRRLHCALLYVYALFPLQLCDGRCVHKDCVYLRVPHFSYSRTCVRYRCVR